MSPPNSNHFPTPVTKLWVMCGASENGTKWKQLKSLPIPRQQPSVTGSPEFAGGYWNNFPFGMLDTVSGVGEGGGQGGNCSPTLGLDCTLKFNEEKISSCSMSATVAT